MFGSLDEISHSAYGGEWSSNGGAAIYKDEIEAFQAGCTYNNNHAFWNHTAFGSFQGSYAMFSSFNKTIQSYRSQVENSSSYAGWAGYSNAQKNYDNSLLALGPVDTYTGRD